MQVLINVHEKKIMFSKNLVKYNEILLFIIKQSLFKTVKWFPCAFHQMRILSRLQTSYQQEMYSISYLNVTKFKLYQQDDQENNHLSSIIVLLIYLNNLTVRFGFTHNCWLHFIQWGEKICLYLCIFLLRLALPSYILAQVKASTPILSIIFDTSF